MRSSGKTRCIWALRAGLIVCSIVLWSVTFGVQNANAEKIRSLITDATLQESGRLLVKETLDIDTSGASRKGIIQVIPSSIEEKGISQHFDVKVHSVTDEAGHKIQYSAKQHGDSVTVHIATTHGVENQRIVVSYEVRRVCNFVKQHPQLYFPITGNNWPFTIEKAEVVLHPPPKTRLLESDLKAWDGPPGSEKAANVRLVEDHILATASDIPPGSGLTLEVDFPGGSVGSGGFLDDVEWLASDWYLLVLLPLLAVAILGGYRLLKSRGASKVSEASDSWKPPSGLTPVELGTLIDGSCDVQDLTGILLDLSVRGYYTIREIPATGFFNLSDRDYEFKRQYASTNDVLRDYETIFLEALFGNSGTSYLSNVQGVFRQFVPKIKDSIYANLVANGFLMKNPEMDRKRFYAIAISMCCVGIALLFLYGEEVQAKAAGLGFVVTGALVAVALQFFPLLTEKGKVTIERAHEFAELMRTAETHDIAARIQEDDFLFHRLLAYAMVLGVSEKWAGACEQYLSLWPDWFQFHRSTQQSGPFIARDFARDVWLASRVAGLTFFAPPPIQYSSYAVGKKGRPEQEHDRVG